MKYVTSFIKKTKDKLVGIITINRGIPEYSREMLEAFKSLDGPYLITIETAKKSKTYEQIKTIHGPIVDHLQEVYQARGRLYNKKQIKTMFKLLVGYYDNLETAKGVIPVVKSFESAKKEELTELINFYVNWSREIENPLEL